MKKRIEIDRCVFNTCDVEPRVIPLSRELLSIQFIDESLAFLALYVPIAQAETLRDELNRILAPKKEPNHAK